MVALASGGGKDGVADLVILADAFGSGNLSYGVLTVTVDKEVNAIDVLEQVNGAVVTADAQVAEADNVVDILRVESGYLLLGIVIELVAGHKGHALNLGGVSLGSSLGGLQAKEANSVVAGGEHDGLIEHKLAVTLYVGYDGELGGVLNVGNVLPAIVELVVAQSGNVITSGVHESDGISTLRAVDVNGTLREITVVHEQDVSSASLILVYKSRGFSISVDAAMHVIGMNNNELACKIFRGLLSSQCAAAEGEHQSESQENR